MGIHIKFTFPFHISILDDSFRWNSQFLIPMIKILIPTTD